MGCIVVESVFIIQDVSRPYQTKMSRFDKEVVTLNNIPFHKANQPSFRKRTIFLIILHNPFVFVNGITYSGLVLSSRTDFLTIYPFSSTCRRLGGGCKGDEDDGS